MCAQKRLARWRRGEMCAQIEREGKCAHIHLLARWRGGEVARWRFPPFTTGYSEYLQHDSVLGAMFGYVMLSTRLHARLKTC